MHANRHNGDNYQKVWQDLNQELQRLEQKRGHLGDALEVLYAQQFESGFIRDDLSRLQRFTYVDPGNADRYFRVQYNPRRAERFAGAGKTDPPLGTSIVNDGCFLCPANIEWQQSGTELGYELTLNSRHYVAWMNPYPLMPVHAVIASRDHIPQAWALNGINANRPDLETIVGDLVALARRAPEYVVFYNGQGAGASIPTHLHFQMFRRFSSEDRLPMERIASNSGLSEALFSGQYPVDFAFWHGDDDSVVSRSTQRVQNWVQSQINRVEDLTANIIAMADDGSSSVGLYFVPRFKTRSRSPQLSGLIGGLEVLGELVFSSLDEKQRLDTGKVDYTTIEQILSAVRAPILVS